MNLDPKQIKAAKNSRNMAIGWALAGFVLLVFLVSIQRMLAGAGHGG